MQTHYSGDDIAKFFNLTERRIRQLADERIIPKSKDGQYPLIECVKGYVRYLQGIKGSTQKDGTHERELKTRLLAAQVITAEADACKQNEKYILVEQVEEDLSNMLTAFRNRMLAIPHRAGTILELKDTDIIKDLIYEALTELSTYNPRKKES